MKTMSEKRFRYDSALEKVYDEDTYNGETTESYGIFELVDKLNELYEENKQLKNENETLKSNYQREIQSSIDFCNDYSKTNGELLEKIEKLEKEHEQLKQELQGMEELLQSYRKTIKHDAELLADATRNGYLPPLNDSVSNDGWICGCCKHFHSGVRDRCDKGNNWVLKDGSCQDFER